MYSKALLVGTVRAVETPDAFYSHGAVVSRPHSVLWKSLAEARMG